MRRAVEVNIQVGEHFEFWESILNLTARSGEYPFILWNVASEWNFYRPSKSVVCLLEVEILQSEDSRLNQEGKGRWILSKRRYLLAQGHGAASLKTGNFRIAVMRAVKLSSFRQWTDAYGRRFRTVSLFNTTSTFYQVREPCMKRGH
jgi:hypothetical protein